MTDVTAPPSSNKLVPILVVLLVIAAFFIGSLYTRVNLLEKSSGSAGNGTVNAGNTQPPVLPTPGPVDIDLSGETRVLGSANAQVALVEFTDFECPYCGQLFKNTFPQIKKEYIDTGKVRYFIKDFPLTQIHPNAQKSAEAANCALEQGKFWEYHDTLFENQSDLGIDALKKYAVSLGLDASQFNSCLDSGKYAQKVADDQKKGEAYGVRGTPSTFVGVLNGDTMTGIEVSGAQPFESFKTAIEEALSKV